MDETGQAPTMPEEAQEVGISADVLLAIMPTAQERAPLFVQPLQLALDYFGISKNPLRVAHFLAQVAHESGELRYLREIWGPTPTQEGYEGRADLGNTEAGDGVRFKGRGLIQVTGRSNYQAASRDLYRDDRLLTNPEILETRAGACLSAGWFWASRGLNSLADLDDVVRITHKVNGGANGLVHRRAYLATAKGVLCGVV